MLSRTGRPSSLIAAVLALALGDLLVQRKVRVGLTGAVVSSTLDVPDASPDRRTGYSSGASLAMPLTGSSSFTSPFRTMSARIVAVKTFVIDPISKTVFASRAGCPGPASP